MMKARQSKKLVIICYLGLLYTPMSYGSLGNLFSSLETSNSNSTVNESPTVAQVSPAVSQLPGESVPLGVSQPSGKFTFPATSQSSVESEPREQEGPAAVQEPVAAKVSMDHPAVFTPDAKVVHKVEPTNIGMPKVVPLTNEESSTSTAVAASVQAPENNGGLEISDVHAISSTGLDTLNIDSAGNWLEKRTWYKKGEQLYEVIHTSLQKASDVRMKFVHEVNSVGRKIDEFYETIGLQQGQMDELLKAVLQDLDLAAQVRGGDLSESERALKNKVLEEQKQIESVGKDLKLIDDIDEQIDKTMMKAFKEIDLCRGLETRAWNNFKEIGDELDDKKARVSYYEMENFHKNIEQKMNYLQTNLLPYLQNQLVGKVNETITQIQTNVATLKTAGLDLNSLMQKDEKGDFLLMKQREKEQETIVEQNWESQQVANATKEQLAQQKALQERQAIENDVWYKRLSCHVICAMQGLWLKIVEWGTILICCFKCIICKIKEFGCHLFGY